jgi:ADP-ribose pyrophosphatase YjhB (NUDIX family)
MPIDDLGLSPQCRDRLDIALHPDMELQAPVRDQIWRRALMKLVRFSAWSLGAVYTSGAQAMLVRPSGEFVMVRPTYRDGWGLVGGFMRPHEQPAQTMLRELKEEVGIDLAALPPLVASYVQHRRRHIEYLYVIPIDDEVVDNATRLELSDVRWCTQNALPPLQREAHAALSVLLELRACSASSTAT